MVKILEFLLLHGFIKMLSSTHWGGDPEIMTMLYKSVIRSKLDYVSPLYGSASSSQLQKLEKFQNNCIRFKIGALNSISTPALAAETGIMSLQYCRNYLTDRFLARSLTQTSSALHQQLLNISSNWRFANSRLLQLCKRAKLILRLKPFTLQPQPTYRQAPPPSTKSFRRPHSTYSKN